MEHTMCPDDTLTLMDLPKDCLRHILNFLDNKTFGVTQYTSKFFHIYSLAEILMRKLQDYILCPCSLVEGPYYHASHRGWTDFANYLRKNEIPFSVTGHDCMTAAYRNKQSKMIEWLIDHGYKPSYGIFWDAVLAGDVAFYERMLKMFPDTKDSDPDTTMNYAVHGGSIPMVEHLLRQGYSLPIDASLISNAC